MNVIRTVNRERVQLLVDALRSGRFEQGVGQLVNKDGEYCCLGVACVVARENGLALETGTDDEDVVAFGLGPVDSPEWIEDSDFAHLPRSAMEWYGFDDTCPDLDDGTGGRFKSAVELNDQLGYNFNRIADAFERTFLRDEIVG
jgi:hypothetical protein